MSETIASRSANEVDGTSWDLNEGRLPEPGVVADDKPTDGKAAFVRDNHNNVGCIRGKQKCSAGSFGFARLQKNVEGNIGCGGRGIITTAMLIGQIDGEVLFPLGNAQSTARQLQVRCVADTLAFWNFVDGVDRDAPIIKTLRFAHAYDAAGKNGGNVNHNQHVDEGTDAESPKNAAGADDLSTERAVDSEDLAMPDEDHFLQLVLSFGSFGAHFGPVVDWVLGALDWRHRMFLEIAFIFTLCVGRFASFSH